MNKNGGQGFYWRKRRRRGIVIGATIIVGGGDIMNSGNELHIKFF